MTKQHKRDQILSFLSLIDAFPAETPDGRRQDENYKAKLLSNLAALDTGQNNLTEFRRPKNHLTILKRQMIANNKV